MKFGIGQPVPRIEDPRLLTGRGQFVDDINPPHLAHGVVLRSPHAHARIRAIDTAAAAGAPGVLAVLTGADYADAGLGTMSCETINPMILDGPVHNPGYPALIKDEVKCVGAAVAFVVAETPEQAKDAAELVAVDYDVLPAVTDARNAAESGAPLVWAEAAGNLSFTYHMGDGAAVAAAITGAAHVVRATIAQARVSANSLEPRSAVGIHDPGRDAYTLYTGNQAPHAARTGLAHHILHIPETRLRVICPDVGGGFGMKGSFYGEDALVLWAARVAGRPVKWVPERQEAFLADSHGRDVVADCELALDAEGRVTALRIVADYNVGAYIAEAGAIPPMFFTFLLSGVYAIPAIEVITRGRFTNTSSTAPYRGAGRPEAAYVVERLMDIAARETGRDPIELRRRNVVKAAQMPYQTALIYNYDCGEFEAVMDAALKAADWDGYAARKAASEAAGKIRGRGVSLYLEGAAPLFNERMEIRFDPGGDVTVLAGTFNHGQGHATAFAQMVSDFLGVPFESVRLIDGDTDKVMIGRGTIGSRSVTVGGAGLRAAADRIIEKGKAIAAHLLEAAEADIAFEDGTFRVAGTDKAVGIVEVAKASFAPMMWPPHLGVGLDGAGDFSPGLGNFPNGCQVAEVEIDHETGKVEIVALTVVDDVGTVINPLLLAGQLHGGVAQGIGQALLEGIVYDDDSGQLLSASFLDYCMPRADDLPSFVTDSRPVPTAHNPLGVKGAGETGTVGAPPAVINAIVDALASAGVADIPMPATPEKVWRALAG